MEGRHRRAEGLCAELAPEVLKTTWHLRQWLVVEVLIGILEFHNIAMEDDEECEVFGVWSLDRGAAATNSTRWRESDSCLGPSQKQESMLRIDDSAIVARISC